MSDPAAAPDPALQIDLRGTPCPLNFIRSKLALEKIDSGAWLQVDLDAGEPEQLAGHHSARGHKHPHKSGLFGGLFG